MKKINKISRSFLALVGLLAFFAISTHEAHAQNPVGVLPDCRNSQLNNDIQSAMGNVGYLKTNAAVQTLGMFGAIDVKAQYCWSQIQSIFESIASLSDSSLNPFAVIVDIIVKQIASQILQYITNACSAALATLNSFKTFVLSQLNHMCIPLPNLSLGLGNIAGLSFSNAQPCTNSVPLFNFGYNGMPGYPTTNVTKFK